MPTITVKNIPTDRYERLKGLGEANRRNINSEIMVCIGTAARSRRIRPETLLSRARRLH